MPTVTIRQTACCGVKELHGIQYPRTPSAAMKQILSSPGTYDYWTGQMRGGGTFNDYAVKCAFLTFTQAVSSRAVKRPPRLYGDLLKEYIEKEGLGTVEVTSTPKRNPNTSRMITHYTWAPNKAALRRWFKKNVQGGR